MTKSSQNFRLRRTMERNKGGGEPEGGGGEDPWNTTDVCLSVVRRRCRLSRSVLCTFRTLKKQKKEAKVGPKSGSKSDVPSDTKADVYF